MSGRDDLVAGEGVDEGSAASTAEAEQPVRAPAASPGPQSAGTPTQQAGGSGGAQGAVLGEPPRGAPRDGAQAAAPDDIETAESRAARERAPGQQYAVGEG
jgi:hypothetical protein